MKKIFLLFGLLMPMWIAAQVGGGNSGGINSGGNSGGSTGNQQNQGQGNPPGGGNMQNVTPGSPYYQNPYNSNPYQQNPYLDQGQQQQNNNFLNDQRNQNQNPDQNQDQNNNQQNKSNQQDRDQNSNRDNKVDPNSFRDLNNPPKALTQDEQLQELYKNDPDYIKYLGSKDKKQEIGKALNDEALRDVSLGRKTVYGSNFWSNNVFDLSDRTPTAPPVDYRLGPGDEIVVTLWGNAELQQPYTIGKDGSIFPRLVGKIYLQGMTFEGASRLIESKFRKIIPPNTNVDVQMGKARTIRVTIIGEVAKQGTYTLSAFNTALNALYRAGGLTSIGNLRRIEIKREGKTVDVIDLYKYLQKGKQAEEVYMEDNDFIYVDIYEKVVNAEGMFKRPMYYQLTADEGLRDLMEYAGGSTANARNSLIHIKTISNETEKYIDIPGSEYFKTYKNNEYSDIVLNDGDVVTLKPINPGLKNIVRISGAVNYPDEYQVKPGERLSDILSRAGGIATTAYLPRAYVYRGANTYETDVIKLDLRELEKYPEQNIELQPGDRISLLSTKDFEEEYFVDMIGSIRKPGRFKYVRNLKLRDLLLLGGGLTLDAENGRIEISNMVDSIDRFNISAKPNSVRIVKINSNLEIDKVSENIEIKPMDRIYVRRKAEVITSEQVEMVGEVNYPGEYVLSQKNERISSLVKRSGGLRKHAYPEGAKLIRENVGPVVIDLPSILRKPESKSDLILRNGDMLLIPTVNDIVSVRGQVQSPINMKYDKDNRTVEYYIKAAGGYASDPLKKRITVRYQSGRIKSTKNFLFIHKYPKVSEGCTINVPLRVQKERKTNFSDVFSYLLSTMTTLSTLVVLSRSLSK